MELSNLKFGVDLVDIARVRRTAERNEEIFVSRILGAAEREQPAIRLRRFSRWAVYARAVAAKESFFKAIGTGLNSGVRWSDVELLDEGGRPVMSISGASRAALDAAGAPHVAVSVGNSKKTACALVVLWAQERER